MADEFVMGRLTQVERAAFINHSARCPSCAHELEVTVSFAFSIQQIMGNGAFAPIEPAQRSMAAKN
jgi:hypothetical protein